MCGVHVFLVPSFHHLHFVRVTDIYIKKKHKMNLNLVTLLEYKIWIKGSSANVTSKQKISNEIQGPHVFFFTLLVMLGNFEPTCIDTIKMVTM